MNLSEFHQAPPFARYVAVAAWFIQNPVRTDAERARAAYTRRKGNPVRNLVLPLFADGRTISLKELQAMYPEIVRNTINTALRREAELGVLGGNAKGYIRGDKYEAAMEKFA